MLKAKTTLTEPLLNSATDRPLFLGVVGDSGTGKTTLMTGLKNTFGPENVTDVCLDDYHRYDRAQRKALGLTALNPTANNLLLMAKHLLQIRNGYPVLKPVYDHSTGTFGTPQLVFPRKVVIVHGLFTLYSPQFARLFDVGIYLEPQEDLRLEWKVRRDTLKRGYTLEQVLAQIEERRADAAAYIYPQKANADLVISFQKPAVYSGQGSLDVRIESRQPMPGLAGFSSPYARALPENGLKVLEIDGNIDLTTACQLGHKISGEPASLLEHKLGNLLGSYIEDNQPRHSLTLALTQALALSRLPKPARPQPSQITAA